MFALGEETSPFRWIVGRPKVQPTAPGKLAGGLECEHYGGFRRQSYPTVASSRDAAALRRGVVHHDDAIISQGGRSVNAARIW